MARVMRIRKVQPSTWEETLEQYLLWKQAQGLRDITVKGHRDVIGLLFRRHPEAWCDSPKEAVYRFMGEPIKPATYNIRRNYLRQFFEWGVHEGIFVENPLTGLKKRKDEGRITCLDEDTLTELLKLPDRSIFAGLRDYALMCLSLDSGIRPGEAFRLTKNDIDLRALEVRVDSTAAKTGVSRTLPILPVTARAISALISARHESWKDSVPVFCSCEGTPLTNATWGDRLERYCLRLGVRFHPYALRHSFATEFLKGGGNALTLQRLMGHASLEMTKRYVHLTQGDVKAQHLESSPMQRLAGKGTRMRRL